VCLVKIEDQKCSEEDRNHLSLTSPVIGQRFMDDSYTSSRHVT
jgi:aspartate carbamoyltransferase regulatory subunit